MSLQSEAARLAVLTAVRDAINAEVKATRPEVLALLQEAQRAGFTAVDVTLPDGTKVAKASLKEPARKIVVTSESALLEWVRSRTPSEVVEMIRPTYLKDLLEHRLAPADEGPEALADHQTGDVFDKETGELVPGVVAHGKPSQPTEFQLRFWPNADTGRGVILERFRQHGLGRGEHPRELPVTAAEWSEVDER